MYKITLLLDAIQFCIVLHYLNILRPYNITQIHFCMVLHLKIFIGAQDISKKSWKYKQSTDFISGALLHFIVSEINKRDFYVVIL
jgi:hypothetical protein